MDQFPFFFVIASDDSDVILNNVRSWKQHDPVCNYRRQFGAIILTEKEGSLRVVSLFFTVFTLLNLLQG